MRCNRSDDRLTPVVNMDMLYHYPLFGWTLTAVSSEGLRLKSKQPQQLGGAVHAVTYHFGRLIFNLSAPELLHRDLVNCDHLDG